MKYKASLILCGGLLASSLGSLQAEVEMIYGGLPIKSTPNVEQKRRNLDKKVAQLEESIVVDAQNEKVWYQLGLGYLKQNHFKKATSAFREAQALKNHPDHRYHLALAYFQDGEVLKAMKVLRALVLVAEKNDLAWTLLGRSYETYENWGMAKACYQKALQVEPNQGQATFLLERMDPSVEAHGLPNVPESVEGIQIEESPLASVKQDKIPRSHVIGGSILPAQKRGDVIPLLECYHVSEMKVSGQRLSPTPIENWNEKKAQVMEEVPVIKEEPLPSIQTELEDL